MVEHVAMTPDRRSLLFSANVGSTPGDIDRRHILRVDVDRAGPVELTSGIGQEWQPAALSARIAFIASTPSVPPRVAIGDSNAHNPELLTQADPNFPSASLIAPRDVTFKARDGLLIHGQLFVPSDGKPTHPGIVFVHGGPPRQMLLGWSYMDYYTHSYAMNQFLASRGYVVLSVNYRLGIGYGRDFQHPASAGATGNSEYQDVVAGAHFLQSLPEVDRARIGIWGGSYGGLLTAQALARDSNLFKAGVDLHGVHDWSIGRTPPQRYEQEDFNQLFGLAFASSPMAAIKGWRSPVLLVQGDDDRNVKFEQTVDLARRLEAQGTPFEEVIIPNEVHGFLRYDTWLRVDSAAIRFLDTHLK
jgi:dipeptidyl aminopeptidase/acylaminoacyl peptidase